ncbi:apidermin 2 [Augochlora pura]
MKSLVILFAIFAIVAAFPEQERERRGILAGPALAAPALVSQGWVAAAPAAKILAAPAIVSAPALAGGWAGKVW